MHSIIQDSPSRSRGWLAPWAGRVSESVLDINMNYIGVGNPREMNSEAHGAVGMKNASEMYMRVELLQSWSNLTSDIKS